MHEKLKESGYFNVDPVLIDYERQIQTRYERKWKEMGRHTYFIRAEKVQKGSIERLCQGVEDVHVKVDKVLQKNLESLAGFEMKGRNNRFFTVKGVYKDLLEDRYALKVISSDKGFEQQYFVTVEKKKSGWVVSLDPASRPYRTPGVKWSLREIARMVSKE